LKNSVWRSHATPGDLGMKANRANGCSWRTPSVAGIRPARKQSRG